MPRKSVKRFCDNDMRKNKGLKRGANLKDRATLWTYRFKLPNMPRTSARPTCVATVRATLFIAASTTVSR